MIFKDRMKLADQYKEWIAENPLLLNCPASVIAFLDLNGFLKDEIEEQPEIDCSKLTRDKIAQILLQWLKTHPGCRIRTDLEVRQGEPEPKNFVEFQCGNITEVF